MVFDRDGVLIDSETTWSAVRQQFVEEHGGRWHVDAQRDMMGMSSPDWSRYRHDRLRVGLAPERISDEVTASVAAQYHRRVPLLPGATETVSALAVRWPLGLASSANRSLIELVLEQTQLERYFVDSVSSVKSASSWVEPSYATASGSSSCGHPGGQAAWFLPWAAHGSWIDLAH